MSELQYPTVEQVRQNTKLTEEKTIQGFIETLRWLDQGAPEKFDGLEGQYKFDIGEIVSKGNFGNNDYGEPCGTVCCIGGAVNIYRADGDFWKAAHMGLWSLETMDSELAKLFYPMENKTPKTAARALRHFLFKGTVSWHIKPGKTYNVE